MVLELRRAVVLKTSVFIDKRILNTKIKNSNSKGQKTIISYKKNGEKHNIDMAANSVKSKVVHLLRHDS